MDPPALDQLAAFISSTAGAGMQWFPDPELEKYVREIARLPEMTEEDVDYKRAMYEQQQAMEYAGGQMEMLGMKQKAEMTAQGLSPEQAQMASETPHPELSQAQGYTEQEAEMARRQHPVGQEDAAKEEEMMAQQQEMEQAKIQGPPPAEDAPADQANFAREQEKAKMTEEAAGAQHGRETEKMSLQEQIADRQHKRDMEMVRAKEQADKTKAQTAKKAIGRPPPKKTAAKKPPPKKGR